MAPQSFIIVAIDGGAASGKSSTARALSERFNLLHVDTGSHYRRLTHEMLRRQVRPDDLPALQSILAALRLDTRIEGRCAEMEIDGRTAGGEIRSPEVNASVSHYAAVPELRQALLAYQRGQAGIARRHGFRGLVMEGRDIGSVIFPDADFRFFLRAESGERTKRRANQGFDDRILERDRIDSSRKAAPLTCPPGAIDIDTTPLTLGQVVEKMAAHLAPRLA
ncbi:MAG: (d)CMP kinase [Opitutaceae bacterium]|nr:(d)CMP kinase [Opitutaceae bacterium]